MRVDAARSGIIGYSMGKYGLVNVIGAGFTEASTFAHYAEAVWDTVRMNNVAQHFVTAFFDLHLKGAGGGLRTAVGDPDPGGHAAACGAMPDFGGTRLRVTW